MRLAHALLGAVVLGGGAGWWALGHPGYETQAQLQARAQAERKAAEPKIYRWRDAAGVLQLTDRPPPAGRKYEQVSLREEVNVVPMSPPAAEQAAPAQ